MNLNDLVLELKNLTLEQKKIFLESMDILEKLKFSRKEHSEKSFKIIDEDTSTRIDLNSNKEAEINDSFETFISKLPSIPITASSLGCVLDCVKKHGGIACLNDCAKNI